MLIKRVHGRNPTRAIMACDHVRYLDAFAAECCRVLRPGGVVLVTFGTSHLAGLPMDAAGFFRSAAERNGLHVVTTLVDRIPSRGLITTRHSTAGRIDDERVVWAPR